MLPHSEDRKVNELLRRVMLQAGLREDDLAARLGVDPKTVRRWLNGRVPYPHNRAAIADLLSHLTNRRIMSPNRQLGGTRLP